MFNNVKAVAIAMLIIGILVGFGVSRITNVSNNNSKTVQLTIEQAQQVLAENENLKAELQKVQSQLKEISSYRSRRDAQMEAEGKRAMGTRPKIHGQGIKKPAGY